MPIIIDELDGFAMPEDDSSEPEIADRVRNLEDQCQTLQVALRDLTTYCQQLEDACREAFAQCPGLSPFPHFPSR